MSVATLSPTTIQVQRRADTADASGGNVENWANHLRLKARVQPISGAESNRYSREGTRVTHKVYVPGSPDIQQKDRITVGGDTLIVHAVRDIDRLGRFLTIEAEIRV